MHTAQSVTQGGAERERAETDGAHAHHGLPQLHNAKLLGANQLCRVQHASRTWRSPRIWRGRRLRHPRCQDSKCQAGRSKVQGSLHGRQCRAALLSKELIQVMRALGLLS